MQRTWNKSTSIILLLTLTSCSSLFIDVIKTGPDFPPTKRIDVFTSRDDIKEIHAAIVILHSQRFDCSERMKVRILKKAIDTGRRNGGDAIVYQFNEDNDDPHISSSERCYLSAAVFKYITPEILEKYRDRR